MIEVSTIKQIVEAILDQPTGDKDRLKIIANEAAIYYRTALICEDRGIDEAMAYFMGTHTDDEYQDFRTSLVERIDDLTDEQRKQILIKTRKDMERVLQEAKNEQI